MCLRYWEAEEEKNSGATEADRCAFAIPAESVVATGCKSSSGIRYHTGLETTCESAER